MDLLIKETIPHGIRNSMWNYASSLSSGKSVSRLSIEFIQSALNSSSHPIGTVLFFDFVVVAEVILPVLFDDKTDADADFVITGLLLLNFSL